MPKKKKVVAKKVTSSPKVKKHHHHWGHHDFMLVLAGGFIVIVLIVLFAGSFRTTVSTYTNTEASSDGVMKLEDQKEVGVTIEGYSFSEETLTVKKGTTITWTNMDTDEHSATADDGSFDTGLLGKDKTGSVTFNEVGTYPYHCSTHPNMTGTIIVEE